MPFNSCLGLVKKNLIQSNHDISDGLCLFSYTCMVVVRYTAMLMFSYVGACFKSLPRNQGPDAFEGVTVTNGLSSASEASTAEFFPEIQMETFLLMVSWKLCALRWMGVCVKVLSSNECL